MGWLRNLRKYYEEFGLRDPFLARDSARWTRWATEHGWSYQAEAPELEGRYRPKADRGAERYVHLLSTELHGLPVIAFEHRRFISFKNSEPIHSWLAYIVIRLPGLPPKEFAEKEPEQVFRMLGGVAPSALRLELVGDELVAQRNDHLRTKHLQADAENLAVQIAAVPSLFWRPA